VRINRDSRGWVIACLIILAAGGAVYVPYAQAARRVGGASGGTWYGIIYGAVGSAMMLFALLLGLKKRIRTMRIGRAYTWMQGHVWLGLLAYPIILFHSGFRFGGPFTQVLMWLFTIVVISGIVGIVIQQYMPGKILRDVQFETIYDQIDHVVEQLAAEAEKQVTTVVGDIGGEAFEVEVVPAGAATATLPQANLRASAIFTDFYKLHVKTYLVAKIPSSSRLKTRAGADVFFDQIRNSLPKSMHADLNDLAQIVEERRQLAAQAHMHHWLHGWLIVHVPLSYGLMLLAAWHAVEALRYVTPHW
jgi:hypothetical protein